MHRTLEEGVQEVHQTCPSVCTGELPDLWVLSRRLQGIKNLYQRALGLDMGHPHHLHYPLHYI
jgi:hypothetical protein